LVGPVIALAVKLKPEIAAPKPPAAYDDQRPSRTEFMNVAPARGLVITLGLAALGMAATTMAPLGALATLLMFILLRGRLADESKALAWSGRLPAAYPLCTRGYREAFDALDRWTSGIEGLITFGRQGLFAHDNTHHTMAMAYTLLDCLRADGALDRDAWARARKSFEDHVVED
jgi:hypothetical protein